MFTCTIVDLDSKQKGKTYFISPVIRKLVCNKKIVSVGLGIKGLLAYSIENKYLDDEFQEFEKYLGDIYVKISTFECTLMCDGLSTHIKYLIINFMIYCDRQMIHHNPIDFINVKKNIIYIFKLMNVVVKIVGEKMLYML